MQATHQGRLFPHSVAALSMPLLALRAELQVEIPKQACQDHAHFVVGETFTQAVALANTEGLRRTATVPVEWRSRLGCRFRQPAFRNESVRSVKVDGAVTGRQLVDADVSLQSCVSIPLQTTIVFRTTSMGVKKEEGVTHPRRHLIAIDFGHASSGSSSWKYRRYR